MKKPSNSSETTTSPEASKPLPSEKQAISSNSDLLTASRTRAVAQGIPGVSRLLQRGLWDQGITDEDLEISDTEETKFSPKWKKPGQMELPIFKGQQFELDFGQTKVSPFSMKKSPPSPPSQWRQRCRRRKRSNLISLPIQGRRQSVYAATTGDIAASGMVVKNTADAAALLAPIRKSAQEILFTIATNQDGLVLEIHKYSKGLTASAPISAY